MYGRKTFLEWTVPYVLKHQFETPEKLDKLAAYFVSIGRRRVIVTGCSWLEDGKVTRGYIEYFPKQKAIETTIEEAPSKENPYQDLLV